MKLSIPYSRYPFELTMGQVWTKEKQFVIDLLHKIHAWKPSKAKSYTVTKLTRVDYHYKPSPEDGMYYEFTVEYFSTVKEGLGLLAKDKSMFWNSFFGKEDDYKQGYKYLPSNLKKPIDNYEGKYINAYLEEKEKNNNETN